MPASVATELEHAALADRVSALEAGAATVAEIADLQGQITALDALIDTLETPPSPEIVMTFQVNKGAAVSGDQSAFTPSVYTLITWPVEAWDVGAKFADNAWTPIPVGGVASLVHFGGQIWVRANGLPPQSGEPGYGNPASYVVKIHKNGVECITAICTSLEPDGYADSWVGNISGSDIAQPGDVYTIKLFATHANAIIDGHPRHTWWDGHVVGPVA